ncbi:MAG: hypothetical protein AMJ78_10825, partial [Omnitrophica WOR_2 bacterium SM23_29]
AFNDFYRAYTFFKENGTDEDKLDCLERLGILCWNTGEIDRSFLFFESAKYIEESVESDNKKYFCKIALEIISLYKEAKKYREDNQEIKSLDCFKKAVMLAQEIHCVDFELKCIRQQSISHWRLNEINKFYSCNQVGLRLAKRIKHKIEEARCLNNIGIYFETYHDFSNALKYYNLALNLARENKDQSEEAECLNNLGLLFSEIGEYESAILHLSESFYIDKKNDNFIGEATTAINIGSVYIDKYFETRRKNYLYKAIGFLLLSINKYVNNVGEEIEIAALNNLGVAYYELGEYENASNCYENALKKGGDKNLVEDEAKILVNIGFMYYKKDNISKAIKYFYKSIYRLPNSLEYACRWEAYFGLGNCYRKGGEIKKAIKFYEMSIEIIEKAQRQISYDFFKIGFIKSKYQVYQQLIDTLFIEFKRNASIEIIIRMLMIAEKAKAQAFLETLVNTDISISERLCNSSYYEGLYNSNSLINPVKILEKDTKRRLINYLQKGTKPTSLIEHEGFSSLKMEFHTLISDGFVNNFGFNQICKRLESSNTVYLEYWLGESQSLLFYLAKNTIKIIELPPERIIADEIKGYLKAISSPPSKMPSIYLVSKRLTLRLLGPVLDHIDKSITTLVVVPDGILNYLPFETLLVGESGKYFFLIEKFRISYSPSITALYFLNTYWGKREFKKKVLGFGAPIRKGGNIIDVKNEFVLNVYNNEQKIKLEKEYSRLPYGKKELNNITRYFGKKECEIIIGKRATETRIKMLNLDDYQIIHFVCHGIINDRYPLESALVLSSDSKMMNDGYLQLKEVYNLRTRAELVILSACNTAAGKMEIGAGLVSLSRSFFAAGARSVLASIWTIKDSTAALCMNSFYRELAIGKSKSDALRNAKISMIKSNKEHPYYWAGFILLGEYDTKIKKCS